MFAHGRAAASITLAPIQIMNLTACHHDMPALSARANHRWRNDGRNRWKTSAGYTILGFFRSVFA